MSDIRQLTVRLDSETFRSLRTAAAKNDESMQALASRILRDAVQEIEHREKGSK